MAPFALFLKVVHRDLPETSRKTLAALADPSTAAALSAVAQCWRAISPLSP